MTTDDLRNVIREGENSQVEFKSGAVSTEELAIAITAFSNGQGGTILVGVEDDGTISGLTQSIDSAMNTISQLCQARVKPPILPIFDAYTFDGRHILAVVVEKGLQKPYYIVKHEKTLFYIRVGTTCRLASPEQIAVLYASHPIVHYDVSPVIEMAVDYLDERRMRYYFTEIKKLTDKYYQEHRDHLQRTSRISTQVADKTVATVAGGLLFGREPSQFIVSAGIRCVAFEGTTKDYAMRDQKFLDAPLLPYTPDGIVVEDGIIEQAIHFVMANTRTSAVMQGIQRVTVTEYPLETLREAITNAVVHRDYALQGGQIQLFVFDNRLEISSPGRLPNTLTLDMIKTGASYARNPVLVKFAENYGYVEHLGLGIPEKIITPMLARGYPEPEFLDTGYEFKIILRKNHAA